MYKGKGLIYTVNMKVKLQEEHDMEKEEKERKQQ